MDIDKFLGSGPGSDGGEGVTRRRFAATIGKAATAATAVFGSLAAFTPTEAAFAQFTVPDGLCQDFLFAAGPDCMGACTNAQSTSCCNFIAGIPSSNDSVCCQGDFLDKGFPVWQMMFGCASDRFLGFCYACCLEC